MLVQSVIQTNNSYQSENCRMQSLHSVHFVFTALFHARYVGIAVLHLSVFRLKTVICL